MGTADRTVPASEPPGMRALRDSDGNKLPIDRSVEFHPSKFPSDPNTYEPLDHCYQRQKEDERHLLKPIEGYSAIRKVILDGELSDNGDGCGRFSYDYDGVTYHVLVAFHLKGYLIAVTGWPVLNDAERARASNYWSDKEIEKIEQFNEDYRQQKYK